MSPEILEAVAALATFGLALVGVPFLIVQLRDLRRSVESGAHAAIYAQGSDVRSHFVEHPHLRPFFFDDVDIDPAHAEYGRVLSLAELFLNYLEHVAVLGDTPGRHNRASLDRFVRNALSRSPILRRRLSDDPDSYSRALRAFAERAGGEGGAGSVEGGGRVGGAGAAGPDPGAGISAPAEGAGAPAGDSEGALPG